MKRVSAQSLKVREDLKGEELRRRVFLAYCKKSGLAEPTVEFAFAAPDRKWRFDFAFRHEMVALEVHGGIFVRGGHSRGAQQLKDFEKMNAAQVRGWKVLQVTPQQLCTPETIAMIRLACR